MQGLFIRTHQSLLRLQAFGFLWWVAAFEGGGETIPTVKLPASKLYVTYPGWMQPNSTSLRI